MRFKLTLIVDKQAFGNQIPFNYQYEQQAVIYKILSLANQEYADWLHDNGYRLDKKKFKLFTYSKLIIPAYDLDKENARLIINSDTVDWYISFLPEKSTEKFIQGIFMNQTFQLGDKKSIIQFKIQSVEALPEVSYKEEMTFETLSPMCVSRNEPDGKTTYLSPEEPCIKGALLISLLSKYKAFYGRDYVGKLDFDFTLLNQPKQKLITIKAGTPCESKVKGFFCRFKVRAPEELMKILYQVGVGEKGSIGFGFVKTIERDKQQVRVHKYNAVQSYSKAIE